MLLYMESQYNIRALRRTLAAQDASALTRFKRASDATPMHRQNDVYVASDRVSCCAVAHLFGRAVLLLFQRHCN